MKTPILGGQYVASSVDAADNRMINLYPEAIPEGGKEPGFLTRCPGLQRKVIDTIGPTRAMIGIGDYLYVLGSGDSAGNCNFTRYKNTGESSLKGYNIPDTGIAQIAYNGTQLMIANGSTGYIYNISTETFSEITDEDFPGASTVDYIDGYFVFTEPDSQKLWVTSLLDGSAIDPLEFASAEGSPDDLLAVVVNHREAWLFGKDSIEVYYNSGALDFPLTRIQGAYIEIGCAAKNSIAKLDNSLFWLGSDSRGSGIIYRAEGYNGVRISDHSIETAIQGFEDISDAVAYSYQQSGHSFYVISFPTGDRTFVYDVATRVWHERAYFIDGEFSRHRSNLMTIWDGEIVVSDYENNIIYTVEQGYYLDQTETSSYGNPQRWLRTWRAIPTGENSLNYLLHQQLELDCQTGIGEVSLVGPTSTYTLGTAEVILRWFDDKWSNEHRRSLGKIGNRRQRVIWRRLGRSRDRVYELSGTDPNVMAIMGADLKVKGTTS